MIEIINKNLERKYKIIERTYLKEYFAVKKRIFIIQMYYFGNTKLYFLKDIER